MMKLQLIFSVDYSVCFDIIVAPINTPTNRHQMDSDRMRFYQQNHHNE